MDLASFSSFSMAHQYSKVLPRVSLESVPEELLEVPQVLCAAIEICN